MKYVTSVTLLNPETLALSASYKLKQGWKGSKGEWNQFHPDFHPANVDPLRDFAGLLERSGYRVAITESDECPWVPGRVY